ncbi:MAG: hypothetical protein PVH77_00755 [Phycisphaerales bacterium]|jgi:hypothetical protein
MHPGTLQTICQIIFAFGIAITAIAGFGSHYFGTKATAIESKKLQEKQQAINSKLDELIESKSKDNRKRLLQKYPAGYVLFGVNLSNTFSSTTFPREGDLSVEYEFDWSNVKIEKLDSKSLTILMPNIRYKPLNTQLIGTYMTIPRRPYGKEYIYPPKPKGTLHRIFVELLEDNEQQLIFVIGFRKTDL